MRIASRTDEPVSKWLIYQGVKISAGDLNNEYMQLVKEDLESSWVKNQEVRVKQILVKICKSHSIWDIGEVRLGAETSCAFRAGSLRRSQIFPQSFRLLKDPDGYPKVIVSNGQRVFSELKMRYLCLYSRFSHVLFSSDFGHNEPDPRIFLEATKLMGLEPEEVQCIGDNFENDIASSTRLGMKAMHIEDI